MGEAGDRGVEEGRSCEREETLNRETQGEGEGDGERNGGERHGAGKE